MRSGARETTSSARVLANKMARVVYTYHAARAMRIATVDAVTIHATRRPLTLRIALWRRRVGHALVCHANCGRNAVRNADVLTELQRQIQRHRWTTAAVGDRQGSGSRGRGVRQVERKREVLSRLLGDREV